MTDFYTYQKKREEFGRPADFEDTDNQQLAKINPYHQYRDEFMERNP